VCRDLKLQQGIEDPSNGLQYLRDYVRMMTDLDYDYEKYSKSLKKDHDIANMNFKILGDKVYANKLANRVKEESYKLLQQKGKEYSIVIPEESDDVVKEGQSLSHCVASYVKDIARGLCKIVFLRQTEKLDESCVTIEVRGNAVRQVRGKGNRKPTESEEKFVETWAKKKELILAY
jgi:PcfJ-like protein